MKILDDLKKVEHLVAGTKWRRLAAYPFRYFFGQIHRHFLYPRLVGKVKLKTQTFWGADFWLLLPAAKDIYLTGGKTHSSEIRLTKYIIKNLKKEDVVIDIGAHFGFYTLLAAEIAENGKVFSFEAAPATFKILKLNLLDRNNCFMHNLVLADKEEELLFHEYDLLHSEYNTLEDAQFANEQWHKKAAIKKIKSTATTIDSFCTANKISPDFIKIDVEGAEFKVIKGGISTFRNSDCTIAMEFVSNERQNKNHIKATQLLKEIGYHSFTINKEGETEAVDDILVHLEKNKLESDNIIFQKA